MHAGGNDNSVNAFFNSMGFLFSITCNLENNDFHIQYKFGFRISLVQFWAFARSRGN